LSGLAETITCDTAPLQAYLALLDEAVRSGRCRGLPDLPGKLARLEHVRQGNALVIRSFPSDELLACIGKFMSASLQGGGA